MKWWDKRGYSQMAHSPHISSTFSLSKPRGARHAWTFSIIGMFYLCTFLFSKRRAADTEVHLKKTFTYLYLCTCMLCTASCTVCMFVSMYGCTVWVSTRAYAYGSKARHCQFQTRTAKGSCCQMKVKGCVVMSFPVLSHFCRSTYFKKTPQSAPLPREIFWEGVVLGFSFC